MCNNCFTMRAWGQHNPHQQILRLIEGVNGAIELKIDIEPRFGYGAIKPWIRKDLKGNFLAIGGSHGLVISCNVDLELKRRHNLGGVCATQKGSRTCLSIIFRNPEEIDDGLVEIPDTEELNRRLEETISWWRDWCKKGQFKGRYCDNTKRSAMVLKGLSNARTGAIAAAATTSLPESPGGCRNWDYRFSWVRDSCFTVNSLAQLGYVKEANGFRRFIERSAAGSADQLQIVFGLGGERWLPENEISRLEGYRGAKPVRVGNDAWKQSQLDTYGELLDLAYRWHNRGESPDEDYWEFLPCSFRLAECLARQGRADEAHQVFERALSTGNDLDLFPEEYDTKSDEMLGNFPQALTHLSLISASVALDETSETTA